MEALPDTTDPERLSWGYLTALAVEALERPDEALAEYIALYEAAPDSTWGMLAALHISPRNAALPSLEPDQASGYEAKHPHRR